MIPLQIVENVSELNSTVDQLSKSSIELAEAAANFGALKIIFGIFMVFIMIMVVMFFYQTFSTSRKVEVITKVSTKVEKFFEEESNRTLGRPQAEILIRRAFNSLSQTIKYQILRARIENHLDKQDFVRTKIRAIVKNEYNELYSFLTNYECNDIPLSENLEAEDANMVEEFMLEQIYQEKQTFTIANMDQATDILIRGLRTEVLANLK